MNSNSIPNQIWLKAKQKTIQLSRIRLYYPLLSFIILSTGSYTFGQQPTGNTSLPATEYAEKIKQAPAAPVVDVRTPEEFAKGHLQNAVNINWNGSDFQNQIAQLDKSKPVFVYCLSGKRSAAAASKMRSDGFKTVYELDGGIMKWRAASLPEVTSTISDKSGLSKDQFDALLKSSKPVLIDFYADWCEPCKKMKPYLDEIESTMKDNVQVIRINADDNKKLCQELKIETLPVLRLYKNTSLVWSTTGYIAKEDIVKVLK